MIRSQTLLLCAVLALAPSLTLGAATPVNEDDKDGEADHIKGHSPEEVQEAKDEFETIDTNKDGFITREEILEMEEVPEKEEIDEFFSTYDTNGDGRVTFDEILTADEVLRQAVPEEEGNVEL
mmetsp:Transcript_50970/g.101366  ORF Transcript_50970/g.101366 Transcript_50970/m.101366 type:complete len:123 (-) Transcript_50970:327-695(-)